MQPWAGHPCTLIPQDQGCKGVSLAGESLLHQTMLYCLWGTDPSLVLHPQIFLGRHGKKHLSVPVPSSGQLPTLPFLNVVLPQGFLKDVYHVFPLEGLEPVLGSRQSSRREDFTLDRESWQSRVWMNAGACTAKSGENVNKKQSCRPHL